MVYVSVSPKPFPLGLLLLLTTSALLLLLPLLFIPLMTLFDVEPHTVSPPPALPLPVEMVPSAGACMAHIMFHSLLASPIPPVLMIIGLMPL